jgi:hypothetical protein
MIDMLRTVAVRSPGSTVNLNASAIQVFSFRFPFSDTQQFGWKTLGSPERLLKLSFSSLEAEKKLYQVLVRGFL